MAVSLVETRSMQMLLGLAGRVLSRILNLEGRGMIGVGPAGIAHNVLEGVYGHTSPENF